MMWGATVFAAAAAMQAQTPASLPAVATTPVSNSAKVTYVRGQLTINAQDSSLGDVLRAVSVKTGAVIEFPADRAQEHLFANAGPGPVRDVLATLLNGSRFNYVMLASPADPSILQRMILTSSDEPGKPAAVDQPLQAFAPLPLANTPPAQQLPKDLPPSVAMESQEIEREVPAEPLSPDAVQAMMKARRESRRLERQQEAEQTPSQ